ncbi:hypothetical protein [Microvirga tunisiensis]|uniref:Uncharacterized protein n=1 Tax=Microvirga tunisiensis TaxID=2108360 RepID=A0A5N7MNL2_9HYPH|nr:hypothetical protein [Microvirga tunisiensis]MPR10235.1 hypothetical protein [Microvirga tunisiensis]MPR28438.1 hypothetical protein [Microvirga tunisiensis]
MIMLNGENSFRSARTASSYICRGGYLSLSDETIIAARIEEVADWSKNVCQSLRAEKGWIMDIYLLKQEKGKA